MRINFFTLQRVALVDTGGDVTALPYDWAPMPTSLSPSINDGEALQATTTQQLSIASNQWAIDFTFIDAHTQTPIAVNGKLIDLANNSVLSTITNSLQAHVEVADVPAYQLQVVFSKSGYKTISLNVGDVSSQSNVVLQFQKSPAFPVLEAAALVALIAFAQHKKKTVGKMETKDVFPWLLIGGGLLAFSIVKKILEWLGVWKGQDSKTLDEEAADPNSPWSPTLWQTLKAKGVTWTYAITYDQAAALVTQLTDAFGMFNDNEDAAKAVFHNFRTQANASYFSDVFQRITGDNLLSYLRGGMWPQDRLSDADVYEITLYLKNLKQY